MADTFTVFVTKYALASKIVTREVERSSHGENRLYAPKSFMEGFTLGKDAHLTGAEAIAAAEAARTKKIASLEKQIAKLKKRDFAKDIAALSPVTQESDQ